ncbi:unnamed protein product [Cyprideis torosa]|uniref:DUF3752 domain-containing protein n=1 Tax=Cyprideis torosa TaxID=163714 RepID=A0A7R8WMI4_9CRUS|nr:unnamed protein product [Cyprideis torosa]CAG0899421.1 unnamed protein product [Cyprideis torosa]
MSTPPPDPCPPVLGPTLPPGFPLPSAGDGGSHDEVGDVAFGPALPPGLKSGAPSPEAVEGPIIGPSVQLIADDADRTAAAVAAVARRAGGQDASEAAGGPDPTERERWMLELPETNRKLFGMGARTFSKQTESVVQDRGWTEAPGGGGGASSAQESGEGTGTGFAEDAVGDASLSSRLEQRETAARDERLRRETEVHNKKKKRKKTLMEIHEKKLKKKMKKEKKKRKKEKEKGRSSPKPERRPFDRDIDLSIGRIDSARTKELVSKSKLLNSKFGSGQQKFL